MYRIFQFDKFFDNLQRRIVYSALEWLTIRFDEVVLGTDMFSYLINVEDSLTEKIAVFFSFAQDWLVDLNKYFENFGKFRCIDWWIVHRL